MLDNFHIWKLFSNNAINTSTGFQSSNIRTDIYDINLSPVFGHIPIFQLCFIGNDYICSNLIIGDSINRGLYNHEHNNDINNNLPSNTIPTIDNMNNFYKQTKIALSNVYTYVNTDYSQIKVYRKTP